jgi:ribosomal protein S8
MSLKLLADVCSHLQNCSKARLASTSLIMTKMNLSACLALQRQGFLSTVTVAGIHPPSSVPIKQSDHTAVANDLRKRPWDAYPDPAKRGLPDRDSPELPQNPADRRIWVGLKYWHGLPVLSKATLISSPTRRVTLGLDRLHEVIIGKKKKRWRRDKVESLQVKPLSTPGECLFLKTLDGSVLESRECLEKHLGGLALFRAS